MEKFLDVDSATKEYKYSDGTFKSVYSYFMFNISFALYINDSPMKYVEDIEYVQIIDEYNLKEYKVSFNSIAEWAKKKFHVFEIDDSHVSLHFIFRDNSWIEYKSFNEYDFGSHAWFFYPSFNSEGVTELNSEELDSIFIGKKEN